MLFTTYTALDITNSDVRLVAMRRNKVKKWMSYPVPEGAIRDGMILEPHTIGIIIDNMFKSLKLPRNKVVCTVTGLPFIYRIITMPKDQSAVRAEAIERAARQEMSLSQEDMYLLWQATESDPNREESDYFVIGVPKTSVRPLLDTLSKARIKPYIGDVKPLALARAAAAKDAMLVSLEHGYYDIVLISNGLVRVMHSVNPGTKSTDKISIINELVDGLSKATKSYNRDNPQDALKPETPLFVSGAMSTDEEILNLLREATGYPVEVIKPQTEIPPEMEAGLFAPAIGLINKAVKPKVDANQYHDIDINLLMRVKKEVPVRTYLAYASVTLLVLVLAAAVYQSYHMKSDATARTNALKAEAARVTQLLANTQKVNVQALADRQSAADKAQEMAKQLDTIVGEQRQISARQADYAGRFNLINFTMPAETKYSQINMSPTEIKLEGEVADPFEILDFTDALETTQAFSKVRIDNINPVQNPGGATFELTISD